MVMSGFMSPCPRIKQLRQPLRNLRVDGPRRLPVACALGDRSPATSPREAPCHSRHEEMLRDLRSGGLSSVTKTPYLNGEPQRLVPFSYAMSPAPLASKVPRAPHDRRPDDLRQLVRASESDADIGISRLWQKWRHGE